MPVESGNNGFEIIDNKLTARADNSPTSCQHVDNAEEPRDDDSHNSVVATENDGDDVTSLAVLPAPDLDAIDGCCFNETGVGLEAEENSAVGGSVSEISESTSSLTAEVERTDGGSHTPVAHTSTLTTATAAGQQVSGGGSAPIPGTRCRLANHFRLVDDYTDRFERIPDSVRKLHT